MKIRILWLSSIDPLQSELTKTGTWIQSMYNALRNYDEISICAVIAFTSKKNFIINRKDKQTTVYSIPKKLRTREGLPTTEIKDFIRNAIEEQQPDIIHVWGIENYWGIIISDSIYAKYRKLIDIQGIKSLCANEFIAYGALSYSEIRKMDRLREWLMPKFKIEKQRQNAEKWLYVEREILKNFKYINTQSEWVRAVLPHFIKNASIEKTGIILRDSFINSAPWHVVHKKNEKPIIFTIANNTPRKGLHITLQAFKIVKEKYPNIEIKIAGMKQPHNSIIKGGYSIYIYKLIRKLKLEKNVRFIGSVNESNLLSNLYQADVFVTSSFIETYSLSLAEAIALGVPSVASYSSALPELIQNGKTGFLYPIGDIYMCAHQIIKLLDNQGLCQEFSRNSSSWYRKEKDTGSIVSQQILTYKKIMYDKIKE